MNTRLRLHTLVAATLLAIFAAASTVFADTPEEKRYEVTRKGKQVATVSTSASRDAVLVSIERRGQPTHHYRAYPQVAAVTVQIDRQQVFTYYMELGRIDVKQLSVNSGRVTDESFSINLSEVSGPARRARGEIEAVRRRFEEDMRILRAVRAYDPSADVKLAEMAYVVLTYDDSIIDGKAPTEFSVTETTPATARLITPKAKPATIAAARFQDTIGECLSICEGQFSECQADVNVRDKTVCHNNRSRCTNNCYSVYGGKKPPKQPIQP